MISRRHLLRDATRPRKYPESAYDSLTRVAAQALDVAVVLVSLVDDQGQFFPDASGVLGEIAVCRVTPLSHSYCKHVVMTGAVRSIEDARVQFLVFENPRTVLHYQGRGHRHRARTVYRVRDRSQRGRVDHPRLARRRRHARSHRSPGVVGGADRRVAALTLASLE